MKKILVLVILAICGLGYGLTVPRDMSVNTLTFEDGSSTATHQTLVESDIAWLKTGNPENVITVGASGCDYTKIQAAVTAAAAGDVILIYPGTYDEQITISKSNISLIGIDKTRCIIQRTPAGSWIDVIRVYSSAGAISGITIANLTVYNTRTWGGGGSIAQAAVAFGAVNDVVKVVTGCRVYNCILKGYQDTVFCYNKSEVIFENCYILGGFDIASNLDATVEYHNCHFHTIHTAGGAGYQHGGTVTVEGCLFTSTVSGVAGAWDLQSADLTLYFYNNEYGMGIDEGIRFDVAGGTVYAGGNFGNVTEPASGVKWVNTSIGNISCAGATVGSLGGIIKGTKGVLSAITDNSTNWDEAHTHVTNNGSDHSYINQNVTTAGTPQFADLSIVKTQWFYIPANCGVFDQAGWSVGRDTIEAVNDGVDVYFPIGEVDGSVVSRISAQYDGGSGSDGIKLSLEKRVGGGITTTWTTVGAQQTYLSASEKTDVYDLPDETMTTGYAYRIKVVAIKGTSLTLTAVGCETPSRKH